MKKPVAASWPASLCSVSPGTPTSRAALPGYMRKLWSFATRQRSGSRLAGRGAGRPPAAQAQAPRPRTHPPRQPWNRAARARADWRADPGHRGRRWPQTTDATLHAHTRRAAGPPGTLLTLYPHHSRLGGPRPPSTHQVSAGVARPAATRAKGPAAPAPPARRRRCRRVLGSTSDGGAAAGGCSGQGRSWGARCLRPPGLLAAAEVGLGPAGRGREGRGGGW